MNDGVYEDLDFDAYLGLPHESRSGFKPLIQATPADYQFAKQHPFQGSAATRLGSAAHAAVLEPHTLADFAEYPAVVDRRLKDPAKAAAAGKMTGEQAEAFEQEHAGKTILPPGELTRAIQLGELVRAQPSVAALLSDGKPEVSMLVTDPETQVQYKCRPDWAMASNGIVVDLKTTISLAHSSLEKSILNHCYEVQASMIKAAHEHLGIPWSAHVLIWVRTDPKARPDVRVEYLDPWWIERGTLLFRRALRKLAECKQTGEWPGEPLTIEERSAPRWGEQWLLEQQEEDND